MFGYNANPERFTKQSSWLLCVETSSNPAAALTPPCGFSFVSPYRKKSCDFFRGLRIFLCKSLKDVGVWSVRIATIGSNPPPSGDGTRQLFITSCAFGTFMQRIAAAPLGSFLGRKSCQKTPFWRSLPLGKAQTASGRFRTTLTAVARSANSFHAITSICLLSAKLGRIFIVKQPLI